jgi:nucleoside-diphosphate-sugar epimerase
MVRKKTVVVTGGVGFLGSHLTGRLLAENFTGICIDKIISVEDPIHATTNNVNGFWYDGNL